jgi:hypothetical protein
MMSDHFLAASICAAVRVTFFMAILPHHRPGRTHAARANFTVRGFRAVSRGIRDCPSL